MGMEGFYAHATIKTSSMEPNVLKPNFAYNPAFKFHLKAGFSFPKDRPFNQPNKANIFKGQGVISKLTTLSDRTIRVQIDCQE